MPPTYETLLAPAPVPLRNLEATTVRLMPFHLTHTGPAQTDIYFQPRSAQPSGLGYAPTEDVETTSAGDGATGRVAAFRGREVHEHVISLPSGYIGCLLSAPPRPTRRTEDVGKQGQGGSLEPTVTTTDAVSTQRSMRKRKAPVERNVPAARKSTRKAVAPVQRFSLDDDEEEGNDDNDEPTAANLVAEVVIPIRAPDVPATNETDGADETQDDQRVSLGAESAVADEETDEPSRIPLHHTTSIAVVDSMVALPSETESSLVPTEPTPTDDTEPSTWVQTRLLVPEATFQAFTIWHPDDAMYTLPTSDSNEPQPPNDARGVMGERDEYVRAVDEWRRLSEVVHGW